MFGDMIYIGTTTDGFPVYDICGIMLVDTGAGTERYDATIFGEI